MHSVNQYSMAVFYQWVVSPRSRPIRVSPGSHYSFQVVHSDVFGSRTFDEAFERSCGGPLCLGTDLFADRPCKFFLEDLILVPFRNFVLLLISG